MSQRRHERVDNGLDHFVPRREGPRRHGWEQLTMASRPFLAGFVIAVVSTLATSLPAARAQGPLPLPPEYVNDLPPEPEAGRHTGFFMRLALGPGYYTMRSRSGGGSISLRAAGAGLNLVLGGALFENMELHGELALQSTLDPKVESPDSDGSQTGTSVTTAGLGAGAGYWFAPVNVYLGASLLLAQARAVDRPTERLLGKTDLGPLLALVVDKEWWLTTSWSIGALARAQLGRFRDPGHGSGGATWSALSLSAAFCVTFE
jgi:hypothetical protein